MTIIYQGGLITGVHVGAAPADALYLGELKIWPPGLTPPPGGPPVFDQASAGNPVLAAQVSWPDNAAAGATVLAAVTAQQSGLPAAGAGASYGATDMEYVGSASMAGMGNIIVYKLDNAPGAGTITIKLNGAFIIVPASVSYADVTTVAQHATAGAQSALAAQSVTCPPGALMLQLFGNVGYGSPIAIGGGNVRKAYTNAFPATGIAILDSIEDTTFTQSFNTASEYWGGMTLVLS